MAWFKKAKQDLIRLPGKKSMPNGMWVKCESCNEVIYAKQLEENLKVCPKCNYHFRMKAVERISLLLDEGSFKEMDCQIETSNPLSFPEYPEKFEKSKNASGLQEAAIVGEGLINAQNVAIGITDYNFMMGSMGSVVGEKLTRIIEYATQNKLPVIIVSASGGGARMQEGIFSLMQMAKVSAALSKHHQNKLLYISVLTDPTGGGVSASFAMLGDLIIAEPNALICFAGPRVIEQTIKQRLPKNFQRSEFLLEHGIIDIIVSRKELKQTLSKVLNYLT
ncbi:MAG: acetyl-CoA carboxylase, carboxyltransferase subunit beta [Candidatus Firestonebacteria bacterium]